MGVEIRIENFINGEFVPSQQWMDSYDPSVDEVWARVPDSGKEEVDAAVNAAKAAFPEWSARSPAERARVMIRIAELIEQNIDDIALIESRDQGKPVSLAKSVEIPRTAHNFRFFASSILHHFNDSTTTKLPTVEALNYTHRDPVGVAGLISPWNLPLYLLSFKIAPAIAVGNTVVAKPSEMTSVSAYRLCQIFVKAGLPPGVVNIVYGTGPRCGSAIVQHPDVDLISFTGSTATGTMIQQMTAPFVKKVSLELGGKNAAIVFGDADLDSCLPTSVRSSFTNQGEVCLCTSRIFVHRSVYDTFVDKFVALTREIKVGDPRSDTTTMGALISRQHLDKVRTYVRFGLEDGGTVLCGEGVDALELPDVNKKGYFMRPTVIVNVSDGARVMQEEIFGPVTCIVPFDAEDELIKRVNDIKYGLCATVWTRDVSRAHRVARSVKVGTVWVNCWLVRDLNMPFGGYKMSGIGREGHKDSIEFFTEAKTVCLAL